MVGRDTSTVTSHGERTFSVYWLLALVMTAVLALSADLRLTPEQPDLITGPFASLLGASTDLGPAQGEQVQLTATLSGASRPAALTSWASARDLTVQWRPGDDWAVIEGAPNAVGGALDVEIHDYIGKRGQQFYASPQQPEVPDELRGEVRELGRILSYTPHHESRPADIPTEVPNGGLSPAALVNAYNATPLTSAGFTGKGQTIVIFAFNGFSQSDLDSYATSSGLPTFTPTVVGGELPEPYGETTMDLQVAHAIAPDARKVVVNARPTVEGGGAYVKIGKLLEDTEEQFPGAVWSFSIGWGCDKLITAADLAPVRSALRDAHRSGTTAFDASGDLAGYECKGGDDWDSAPSADNTGLDSVASLPEMTNVGGTTLSTDAAGKWLSEQSWFDIPLTQGTGGGVSALFDRPDWQDAAADNIDADRGQNSRLTPDIAAVADPFTGIRIVHDGQDGVGGGTSMSAPIWAGFAAVMNQFLLANGGRLIGDLNPMLYNIAEGAPLPAFRDVTLGGNAVDDAGPGYDLVTGLGTPDVDNLVRNILIIQRANR
jgi:kumamolisin